MQWLWRPSKESLSLFPVFPPSICHEVMGPDAMISVFCIWVLRQFFSLSLFLLSGILRMVSSASSVLYFTWCTLHVNKQADKTQPLMYHQTHLKSPWCWERLKVGEEGDDRGWDAWKASPIQRTWVSVNAESWQWTERPGMLHSVRGVYRDNKTELK